MGKPKNKLWHQLKSLAYSNKSKNSANIVLRMGDKLYFDTPEICNCIDSFFTAIASNLVAKFPALSGMFRTNSLLFERYYLSKEIMPGNSKLRPVFYCRTCLKARETVVIFGTLLEHHVTINIT